MVQRSLVGAEYVWTGAEDGFWTNAANWTVGGAVATQPPGQVDLPDGTVGGSLGDTAVFSRSSANTTINLAGHHSISNVTVTGAATPCYTFGTSASQILHFEMRGRLLVDASVVNMPLLTCGLGIVTDGIDTAFDVRFENNAAETLVLDKVGYVTKAPGAKSWLETTLTLAGTGNFRLEGVITSMNYWSLKPTFNAPKVTVAADWTGLHNLVLSRSDGLTLELEDGAVVAMGDSWCSLQAHYDTLVTGNGTVRMASSQRNGVWWDGEISIAANRTLTLDENVTLANSKSDSAWRGSARRTNAGTLVINGPNTMPKSLHLLNGTTRISSIAQLGGTAAGEDFVLLEGGARLVYAGAGETVARTVVMTNGAATVEHAGTGALAINGALETLSGKTGRLTLVNDSGEPATWGGAIPATVAGVTVEGSTGWTLSGANAVTSLTIKDGSALCLAGAAATAGVATVGTGTSGTGTLRIPDGVTVTLASVSSGGGLLNVVTEGTGRLVVSGQSGTAPGWLLVNGKNGEYEADGTLVAASYATTTSIAARGDMVPDAASEMVGITTAGSGGADTLAADSTTVAGLVQKSDTAATIDIAANQTLTAGMLAINDGKASLTVGAADGTGTFAAGTGTFIVDNANPSADLTVRAAANLSAVTALDKRGSGTLRFTGVVAPWTGTLAVNAGEVAFAAAAQPPPTFALSGSGVFAKESTADWTLSTLQPDFTGDLVLRGGVTRLGRADANVFGAANATLTITNGAALDLSGGLAEGTFSQIRLENRHVRIAGSGPDGCGAIRPEAYDAASGASSGPTNLNDRLFTGSRLTLLDDATLGMGMAGGVRYCLDYTVVDQQHHALAITNQGALQLRGTVFTNGGEIVMSPGSGSLSIIIDGNANTLGTADDPPVTAYANSTITFGNGAKRQDRPLNVMSNLTFNNWHALASDDPGCNGWGGPISLSNPESLMTLYVYSQANRTFRIGGQVSGPGGVKTTGAGRFFFSHPANAWTGDSTFGDNAWPGFWQFDYSGSIPAYSNATFGSGVARLPMGPGERWPADRLADFLNEANMASGTIVQLDTTDGDARLDYSVRAVTNAMKGTLRNGGTGKLVVSGPLEFPGNLSFDSSWTGTVEVTGSETVQIASTKALASSSIDFPGVLHFRNASNVRVGADGLAMSGEAGKYCMVKVENSQLSYEEPITSTAGFQPGFSAGTDIIEISGKDAAVTNLLRLGSSSGHGAVYQRDGHVGNIGYNGTHYGTLGHGNNGYGYYELSGGTYSMMGAHRIGFNGKSTGVLAILGGNAKCDFFPAGNGSSFNMGVDNSVGVLYVKRGTMDMGHVQISICEWNSSHHDGIGIVTLDGEDAKLVHTNRFNRLCISANATAIVNLNAGVLETRAIGKGWSGVPGQAWSGAFACINFGGGTLKARPDDVALFDTGVVAVDRITAFAGGAAIDTAGADHTLDLPIQAPEGMGVASVDGTGVVGETFIGSPAVVIENTGASEGYGATAYADFDSTTRKVTGIRVTSSGCNYTSAQAVIRYGIPWITNAVTLAASPSGGLVKKGEGTLTLNAANTFTGPVSVEGGTLKVGANGALPSGAPLALSAGSTLDLNGRSFSCSSISSAGGAVANGTLTLPPSLAVDLAEAKAGSCLTFSSGSFAFPANATLTLENTEVANADDKAYTLMKITGTGSFSNLPRLANDDVAPWNLVLGNGGREVRLAYPAGTLLIFR